MQKLFIIIVVSMLHLNAYEIKNFDRLVVVITKDWSSSGGVLYCLEKKGNLWKKEFSWKVIIGRNGLAWGIGLNPDVIKTNGKREGDGKSPAGMFLIRKQVYGYARKLPFTTKWSYTKVTKNFVGVDDSKSIYYNQIINKQDIGKIDWNSYEDMRRDDKLYKWVLMIEHNTNPAKAMMGSCIFIHLWRNANSTTSGCTAMSEKNILKLISWLSEGKDAVILQLPESEYNKIKTLPLLK
jgi:D-alanyl-D-alanine dipeptidase